MKTMDRTRAIDILEEEVKTSESLSGDCEYVTYKGINHTKHHTSEEFREAAKLAIASLKTDDYFEAMDEDVEMYTKSDIIAMLEEIRLEATKMKDSQVNADFWEDYDFIVRRKINSLKGE